MARNQEQWSALGNPDMITEKHFSLSHAAFWHDLLPVAESYIRELNAESARFCEDLDSSLPPEGRGLVNETGFRLFAESLATGCAPSELDKEQRSRCADKACQHVSGLRKFHRAPLRDLDVAGMTEALVIADRLLLFFSKATTATPIVLPQFAGCGWIEQCQGDVLAGSELVEIKAGARLFRSVDLRQVLCYCALNFASKTYDIVNASLVNPRSGRYVSESLEHMCRRLSGRPATGVLSDIVAYISDPPDRYAAG